MLHVDWCERKGRLSQNRAWRGTSQRMPGQRPAIRDEVEIPLGRSEFVVEADASGLRGEIGRVIDDGRSECGWYRILIHVGRRRYAAKVGVEILSFHTPVLVKRQLCAAANRPTDGN
jgi:hypothetical protein